MKRLALVLIVGLTISACSTLSPQSQFEEGQRWAYQTRPQEPNSTVLIVKLRDTEYLGKPMMAVYVVVERVCFNDPCLPTALMGFAISEDALKQSVTEYLWSEDSQSGYMSMYAHFDEVYNRDNATIHELTIAQTLDIFETQQ